MAFKVDKTYHGFKLVEEKKVDELNGVGRLFVHEKSGARLFSILNDDDNKVFAISFRTPPHDDTGLPHILEHSVLCGSRKFPTKEPFVELIKGSLNTFLNAMTFSDKTMYPLASRNEKDFMNLMDVYLDAVFYPKLYTTPEILMQEGWHYEIENKEAPITYKGVVYNEMKGAFSSPEGVLMRKVEESLFKDTIYRNESGGDPEAIPNLTQDAFVAFHKRYYHPSNSYIILYGDMDLDKQLSFIDGEYLKDFDMETVQSDIAMQEPYKERVELEVPYSISEDENEMDKTFLSLNFVTGTALDKVDHIGMDILEYLLLENPASPLKNALVAAKLGKDVFGSYYSSILQPTFSVIIKNSNLDKKEEFNKITLETLENLVKNGIDEKLVEACINITEFRLREADLGSYPKGLFYGMMIMESWLYGGDPFVYIQYDDIFKEIRKKSKERYFENLIDKYLLKNTHSSLLTLKPEKGLSLKKEKELEKKLADFKASLNEEELNELIQNTKNLIKRQNTPDSEEVLESIPMLCRDDIKKEAEKIPFIVKDDKGARLLHTNVFTNKIAYLNVLFDSSAVEEELVPYVSLLSYVLGKVNTENYNYSQLSNEININTGGINFTTEVYGDIKDIEKYYKKFTFKGKALRERIPQLINLGTEIISSSKFDDFSRLHEIIAEVKSRTEMQILQRGHVIASNRVASYFSSASDYIDKTSSIGFYKFIADLDKNFENKKEEIARNLEKVSAILFNKNNIVISITGEEKEFNEVKKNLDTLMNSLSAQVLKEEKYIFKETKKNEGLLTPANVQYVAKGYNIRKLGYDYTGKLLVLKTITSLDYLWNKVRVQGGAYGCFAIITRNGNAIFTSYRDPNISGTLNVYNNAHEYLKDFSPSEREMTKYIIGTISELDAPLSPSMKGERNITNYFRGISEEDIQKEREDVLNSSKEDIRELSKIFNDVMKQDFYAVIGNENKIKSEKDIFGELINLFE
ncbi:insulinase family protein [Hathewaya massiliensis]|uniref:insulinase family protein n=1 Tax=Hathewaya massiliensis TaxID=1964382 RepID=UPI00115BA003|nr:insulinase family protein [Hathewaya massiliensis]